MISFEDYMAKQTPEMREAVQERAEELEIELALHELREALNFSQTELARSLGISQPSVSDIEQRGNEMKIATLKRYIEALGGRLRLDVQLPDGKHVVVSL